MLSMGNDNAGDDLRLLGLAYVEFLAKGDRASLRLLERDKRRVGRAVSGIAVYLMDAILIPVQHEIVWQTSWVEVDFRRRTEPELAVTLAIRDRYRRHARGLVLLPRRHLRKNAEDIMRMLGMAYLFEERDEDVTARDAILTMLYELREKFCHSGDAQSNA